MIMPSILDRVDLNRQKPKTMERANHLFKFIQQNPCCTRKDMQKIVRWATNDNLQITLGVLKTQNRIRINTGAAAWTFEANYQPMGMSDKEFKEVETIIETALMCQGLTQAGLQCKATKKYVRRNGFCMHHGPIEERYTDLGDGIAVPASLTGRPRPSPIPKTRTDGVNWGEAKKHWGEAMKPTAHLQERYAPLNYVEPKPHTITASDDDLREGQVDITIKIPTRVDPVMQRKYANLQSTVEAFIAGQATVKDLKEALE